MEDTYITKEFSINLKDGRKLTLIFEGESTEKIHDTALKFGITTDGISDIKKVDEQALQKFEEIYDAIENASKTSGEEIPFKIGAIGGGSPNIYDKDQKRNHFEGLEDQNVLVISPEIMTKEKGAIFAIIEHETTHVKNDDFKKYISASTVIYSDLATMGIRDKIWSFKREQKRGKPDNRTSEYDVSELKASFESFQENTEKLKTFYKDNNIDPKNSGSFKTFYEESEKLEEYYAILKDFNKSSFILYENISSEEVQKDKNLQDFYESNPKFFKKFSKYMISTGRIAEKAMYSSDKATELIADEGITAYHKEFLELQDTYSHGNANSGSHPDKHTRKANIVIDQITEKTSFGGAKITEEELAYLKEIGNELESLGIKNNSGKDDQIIIKEGSQTITYNVELQNDEIGNQK